MVETWKSRCCYTKDHMIFLRYFCPKVTETDKKAMKSSKTDRLDPFTYWRFMHKINVNIIFLIQATANSVVILS